MVHLDREVVSWRRHNIWVTRVAGSLPCSARLNLGYLSLIYNFSFIYLFNFFFVNIFVGRDQSEARTSQKTARKGMVY